MKRCWNGWTSSLNDVGEMRGKLKDVLYIYQDVRKGELRYRSFIIKIGQLKYCLLDNQIEMKL